MGRNRGPIASRQRRLGKGTIALAQYQCDRGTAHGKVVLAIAIEIADHQLLSTRRDADRIDGVEASIRPEKHSDGACVPEISNIGLPIAIEVTRDNAADGFAVGGAPIQSRKIAFAIARENMDISGSTGRVRRGRGADGDIEVSIEIKIPHGDGRHLIIVDVVEDVVYDESVGNRVDSELAVAVAQQNVEKIARVRGNGQIEFAVVIEIAGRNIGGVVVPPPD